MPDSAVRTVISPVRLQGSGTGGEDLLRQSWALYQTPGLEQHLWKEKKQESGSKKSLTYVLIFHADLQSEVVVFFILFSSKNEPPPLHKINNTLSIIQLSSENPYQHL